MFTLVDVVVLLARGIGTGTTEGGLLGVHGCLLQDYGVLRILFGLWKSQGCEGCEVCG